MTLPSALTNCVAVYRQWEACEGTDLIGLFASDTHADDFCQAQRNKNPKGSFLVAVNTYDWRMKIYRPTTEEIPF